jgi:archaellum component FlaF (FlaF/FlaG flagellin family)
VFSDVRVNSSGATIFTNTNVSASVGSKRKEAIFPYFRSILFLNDYGIYALVGSTTSKLSDALDGVFTNIDFTYPITGGQVIINNILCAAFNFKQSYYGSSRFVQAVFFEKKWFFTSQGNNLNHVTSAPLSGVINLYGVESNALYKLYGSTTAQSNSVIQTALNAMGDPIRDKQALKIGIEATLSNSGALTVTVDSENNSSPQYTLSNFVTWTNNLGNVISWSNASSTIINWSTSTGYQLYKTDAQQWGKYLGMTVTSTYPGFTINGFEYEHELRARF